MPPTPHSSDDARWMQQALDLARTMRGHVWPNPPVGCVVVKEGVCIAKAATHPGGRPHAERAALEHAGDQAQGATLYVTLEPCCHWGKTPPCVDAILAAGITRVVASMRDPDPRVNGGGFAQLRAAGITVEVGEGAEEAQRIMAGFLYRVQTGRPHITLLDQPMQTVPEGEDALLLTRDGQPVLILPTGQNVAGSEYLPTLEGRETDVLLSLGVLGLTSIAVHADDPVLSALQRNRLQTINTIGISVTRTSGEFS